MILGAIGQVGVDGGVGYVVEYAGEAIRELSMEERMTICNMSIEWGARAGMIAPDETTFAYLEGREHAPAGRGVGARGRRLALARRPTPDATYDTHVDDRRARARAAGDLGHEPRHGRPGRRAASPTRPRSTDPDDRAAAERALAYMGLGPGSAIDEIRIDRVFIGSCTNSRIEDLRAAAAIVAGTRSTRA